MTINWKKLYRSVAARRKEMGCSWRELAKNTNLTASAFTRISQGKPLSAANLLKVLQIAAPSIHRPLTQYLGDGILQVKQ